MKTSESIKEISKALLAAQKEIGAAEKGKKNPFFHSAYSTLGDVMAACKEALNKQGISVVQPVEFENGTEYVETVLLHESGEYISARMKITPAKDRDPQSQGSAITYAKRYSLQSLVFIPSEDDDGNKASQPTHQEPTKEQHKPADNGSDMISDGQAKRLFAIWKTSGKSDAEVKQYLLVNYKIDQTKFILKSDYPAICEWAGKKTNIAETEPA